MAEPRNDEQAADSIILETPCEMSLDDHIEVILTALTLFGVGVQCETAYRAILVIAEAAKSLHNHADFDASELAQTFVERVTDARVRLEAAQLAAMPPTDGPVH